MEGEDILGYILHPLRPPSQTYGNIWWWSAYYHTFPWVLHGLIQEILMGAANLWLGHFQARRSATTRAEPCSGSVGWVRQEVFPSQRGVKDSSPRKFLKFTLQMVHSGAKKRIHLKMTVLPQTRVFFAPNEVFWAQNDRALLPSSWGTLLPMGAAMALLADPLDQPMGFVMALLQWHKVYKSSEDELHRPPWWP